MIRITKGTSPPQRLRVAGAENTIVHCEQYGRDPAKYSSGELRFRFQANIYGHHSVKKALKKAQHEKCCYCESKFASTSAGDIEHFRPKEFSQQGFGEERIYPGYFWLVYDWNNLYYSCSICNRSFKRNQFPLLNPETRVRDNSGEIELEEPVLVDPCEEARDHIRFHQEVPIGRTERGKTTIRMLGLDRPELNEARRSRLTDLRRLTEVIKLLDGNPRPDARELVETTRSHLQAAVQADSTFSSMAQDFLEKPPV